METVYQVRNQPLAKTTMKALEARKVDYWRNALRSRVGNPAHNFKYVIKDGGQRMAKNNDKKRDQLGMPIGTAAGRLRKMIMFALLQKAGQDICHQCGERIKRVEDLSVEHIIPWLDSDDPIELYFDLDNITFSHLKCNIASARRFNRGMKNPEKYIELTCARCGCQFDRLKTWHKDRKARGQVNVFCSQRCAGNRKL